MLGLDRLPIIKTPFLKAGLEGDVLDIPGDAVSETLHYLRSKGGAGKLDGLVDIINREVIAPFNVSNDVSLEFSEGVAFDADYSYSIRFWYLLNMAMKGVMSDPFFCFKDGGDRLGAGHRIFERGPFDRSPYSSLEVGGELIGVKGHSLRGCVRALKSKGGLGIPAGADEQVLDLVNSYLGDKWLSLDELTEENVVFSYDFVQLFYEACRIVSDDGGFLKGIGEYNIMSIPGIFFPLLSGFNLDRGLRESKKVASRYANVTDYCSVFEANRAFLSVRLVDEFRTDEYYSSMIQNSWDIVKSTILCLADKVYNCDVHILSEDAHSEDLDIMRQLDLPLRVRDAAEEMLVSGCADDYRAILFSWKPRDRGIRRFISLPSVAAFSAAVFPAVQVVGSEMPLAYKLGSLAGLISVPVITQLLTSLRRKDVQMDELCGIIEEQRRIDAIKASKIRAANEELQYRSLERIITNGFNLLLLGDVVRATEEFEYCLKHAADPKALLGYSMAVFRQTEQDIPEVLGAKLKPIAPGESLSGIAGAGGVKDLRDVYYFKEYPSLEQARAVAEWSKILSDVGAVKLDGAFEFKGRGYGIVKQVHKDGEPGVRAPNLLEARESGELDDSYLDVTMDLAARLYARIWSVRDREGLVRAGGDTLEVTVKKCVGVEGSEEPFTTGLYAYTGDSRIIGSFRDSFKRYSGFVFRLLDGLQAGVSFDFSPRNIVYVSGEEQVLVDLDLINDSDIVRFFARFTEMSDFIKDRDVVLDSDVVVCGRVLHDAGDVIRYKDGLFYGFLEGLERYGDDELRSEISSEAESWVRYAPLGRFLKAFRHFGSCGHWAKKADDEGRKGDAKRMRRNGIKCLENAVRNLGDMRGGFGLSDEDSASLYSLESAFSCLLSQLKVSGNSDLHVHGGNSHCVAKRYGLAEYEGAGVSGKLSLIEARLVEKFESLKGVRDHICIVEHAQFVRYGVPFRMYKEVFDRVSSRYEGDFISVSSGIELSLGSGPAGEVCVDHSSLDELMNKRCFDIDSFEGVSDDGLVLSSSKEILAGSDAILLGVHKRYFDSGSADIPLDGAGYVALLEGVAGLLAGIKDCYGQDKLYILVHPWKCAVEINDDYEGGGVRISYPSAGRFDRFCSIVYENDIVVEVNGQEFGAAVDAGLPVGRSTSLPLIGILASYYGRRNAGLPRSDRKSLLIARSSDAHHHDELSLVGVDHVMDFLQGTAVDAVLINRY